MHICILPFINFNKHYLVHLYNWSDRFVCPARAPCGLHSFQMRRNRNQCWRSHQNKTRPQQLRVQHHHSPQHKRFLPRGTVYTHFGLLFTLSGKHWLSGWIFFQCLRVKNLEVMGAQYPHNGIYIPKWRHGIINCAVAIFIFPFAWK